MIETVLQLYHDSPMAGHAGIHETLDRMREHYFLREWVPLLQSMYVHVQIVKNVKPPIIIQNHLSQHIRHQVPPFEVWQVELVGPLPISPQ